MCRTLRRIRTPFTHRTDREINLCVRQTRREGQRDPNNGLRMPLYCASTHFRFFSRWFLISARINVPTVGCHFLDVLIRIQRWKWILQSAPQSPHRKSKRQVNHFTRVISIFSLRFHAISATQTRASISHWFFSGLSFSVCESVCVRVFLTTSCTSLRIKRQNLMRFVKWERERKCIMPSKFYVFWFCIRDDVFFPSRCSYDWAHM